MPSVLYNIKTNCNEMKRKALLSLEQSSGLISVEQKETIVQSLEQKTSVEHKCNSQTSSSKNIVHTNLDTASDNTQNKLTVVSDSHRNNLANFLNDEISGIFFVFCHTLPGVPLNAIISTTKNDSQFKKYTKNDWILLIGRSNDLALLSSNYKAKNILKSIVSMIKEQIGHTSLY